MPGTVFAVPEADAGATVAAALRRQLAGTAWSQVRRLCATGKVRVDGELAVDPARRVRAGQQITLEMTAPRPTAAPPTFRVAFEDAHLIVIEKPSGISSVPFERRETGTAMDLVRAHWRQGGRSATRTPLYVVHRLDKETSGLLCFAKTRAAARGLHETFQSHRAEREYAAVAHGVLHPCRLESELVPDRGDGLRGTSRGRRGPAGQRAITVVVACEPLAGASLCTIRPETGRTHQIRIQLAEAGHPIVGEPVYIRDFVPSGDPREGRKLIEAPRLMLHAARLGLAHPVTGERIDLRAEPPPDFARVVERLRP